MRPRPHHPIPTVAATLLVTLTLLAPTLGAQGFTSISVPVDESFEEILLVKGRVAVSSNKPASQIDIEVGVEGLEGVRVNPEQIRTRCNGDFQVWFPLRNLTRGAEAFVRILPGQGVDPVEARAPVDVHFRVADLQLTLDEPWERDCEDFEEMWPTRLTVWGRLVDGAGEHYMSNGTRVSAAPMQNHVVNLTIQREGDGEVGLPPGDPPVRTDERGDFVYSWVFPSKYSAATVRVYVDDEKVFEQTWEDDPQRLVIANVDVGDGRAPPEAGTPGPGAFAALAAGALAAAALTRARRSTRRP